ncbi:pseudouridine synthase [Kurthia sp. 3B1D]|uniref:Pseudouridine synthase n=1 Tax=Candidatus Kurthia intestinigallinarum TaxID=1562256 RepID=A0A433RYM8_9BACL|nr:MULTISPECIES: pseudouridine synthase [unclassified Kurthia]RUS58381.1 pseudouridine synthase [Kurthia sp. 3B1D]
MRLDKLLANMGFGTRKDVKKLIKQKAVTVDEVVVKDVGLQVDPEKQAVVIFGERVTYEPMLYLLMNKPAGVISATEDNYDQTVIDLLEPYHRHFEPFPVGRLDKDTEGFLLITNDGQLTHNLLSPKKHVPKVYYAKIAGEVKPEHIEMFQQGIIIDDGYQTKPAKLTILNSGVESEIELEISEGKFHQVKRMFKAIDTEVTYLKRLSMGPLQLGDDLALGEYRELTEEEVLQLKDR